MEFSSYKITIVVDPEFGDRLSTLATARPVWIADTATNRKAAERHWREHEHEPDRGGVTTFRFDPTDTPEDQCAGILETVYRHHGPDADDPPCTVIEVIGARLTSALRSAFGEYGVAYFAERPDGFQASTIPTGFEEID
jgi:hypothetical protein